MPREVLALTMHAKVLSLITSERHATTGLVHDGNRATVVLAVPPGSWRDLIAVAAAALNEGADERGETLPEVLLDLDGTEENLPDGCVLLVRLTGATVQVRHRVDVIDEDYAQRLLGYYLRGYETALADLDAAHHRATLLSAEEIQLQMHGLAGPRRELPAEMFVEQFEERVRTHPDRLAAAHNEQHWTYAELNERANRIAHTLVDRGLTAEQVVAVVMERNLDWLAAALAVFKAGGVYLPVHPAFPAERIATQLERSGCRLVLSEPSSTATLDAAVVSLDRPTEIVYAADACRNERADDPRVPIEPGQLAYIYFTSGSTGAPKGAMCEHVGMLNHLYIKIEDMELTEHDVVTQTASQCFDISLWQFAAPWLSGGSVRIVDTDVQLDVDRFLDELLAADVRVAQLVPSYFEILLTRLEQSHRDLGRLRSISVTGEALKFDLVRRWFAAYPQVKLVNAYGATEVSDDTMHEVLTGVPERGFVTVGRSLRNVNTYILDENLALVPLGSPGEIAFSGMAVGRGYINDEERTRQAFVIDPLRPNDRMYRTGDFGRWLPEGRIEFLGRRDQQVKIRGFRIEIGEIENKLLAMTGVRDAAVVLDGGRNLVAFYAAAEEVEAGAARDHLAQWLPEYMVPSYVHRLDTLPLNENGKVDKKVLAMLAGTLGHGGGTYVAPASDTERRLATAWAEVLNVPVERIGRDDDFFALGGTSLAAVRLVVKLDRRMSLRQLTRYPVLSALAEVVDQGAAANPAADDATSVDMLQPLNGAVGAMATIVCFPYAGGNAVNYQLLAKELERDGVAVYGVELPGHDLGGPDEPLTDVPEIAERAASEITRRIATPVMLWGHCAGAAHALATARLLEQRGVEPRVFLAAQLLDDTATLAAELDEIERMDDREITRRLLQDSAYIELDGLKPKRAALVAAAYRHDIGSADRFLMAVRDHPEDHRLRSTVHVVVGADDPATAGYQERYRDWDAVSAGAVLHELPEGGHYFARTRPGNTAALVLEACTDLVRRPA
ncbi:amino acid adenylation domain-containing protein [Micromonospora sp. NPDC051296]|uniref:non-ribosomal peptide synthetase family protein n=1 Tax=Micromonospora sp. NPDC051296 TaxID=3155046 RepID=UPI00341F8771